MAYRGDIDAKRLARYDYWRCVREWMCDDFLTRRHLVLASEYGGDIATLKGMGVPPDQIVAVDVVKQAAEECAVRHPDVQVLHDDVEAVIRRAPKGYFGSVFLDCCSWFTPDWRRRAVAAALHVPSGGHVGIGVMRAREGKHFTRQRLQAGSIVDAYRAKRLPEEKPLWANGTTAAKKLMKRLHDGRGAAIYTSLQGGVDPARRLLLVIAGISYQNKHTPMLYRAFGVETMGPTSRKVFLRKCRRRVRTVMGQRAEAFELAQSLMEAGRGQQVPILQIECASRWRTTRVVQVHWDSMRAGCVELAGLAADDGDDPALCLNVSRGTLAAWRAHYTRGSYEVENLGAFS